LSQCETLHVFKISTGKITTYSYFRLKAIGIRTWGKKEDRSEKLVDV
jgi:hypothetical protein